MPDYSSESTIENALAIFFEKYQLGENGGMGSDWARLKVGKLYIPFPNTAERKRALMFHDIHHIVTGYESSWKGEAAIAAWEISSGCGDYRAAWVLDLGGMLLGLLIFPKLTFNAFIRGRRTLNLYHKTYLFEDLRRMSIEEVRNKLRLNEPVTGTVKLNEIMAFTGWSFISFLMWGLPVVVFYGLVIWWFLR